MLPKDYLNLNSKEISGGFLWITLEMRPVKLSVLCHSITLYIRSKKTFFKFYFTFN